MPDTDYPVHRKLSESEKYTIRNRVINLSRNSWNSEKTNRLAIQFNCSPSQIAGIKAHLKIKSKRNINISVQKIYYLISIIVAFFAIVGFFNSIFHFIGQPYPDLEIYPEQLPFECSCINLTNNEDFNYNFIVYNAGSKTAIITAAYLLYGNVDNETPINDPLINVQFPFFLKPDDAKSIPVVWNPAYTNDKTQSLWFLVTYNCKTGITFFKSCKNVQTHWFNIEWVINKNCTCPKFAY